VNTQQTPGRHKRAGVLSLLCAGALSCGGCDWFGLTPPTPPPPPADSLVLRGDALTPQKAPEPGSAEAKLAGAQELFRRGEYSAAGDLFHSIADKVKKAPESVVLEATFYEAECYRLQGRYVKSADTYMKLIKQWPSNPYNEVAAQHLFEIANYWLDDTRTAMKEAREAKDHTHWFTTPRYFHIDKSKPFADEEGQAIDKLEQVHFIDYRGNLGLGDKALFLCGSVKFFNEDYKEADHYFTQLHERYPNSEFAPQAVELGIIAKHLSTGGPDYDGRKVAEARMMVGSALSNYPELAKKKDFLYGQLYSIAAQQAAKDYSTAEFFRRTGHPGSAWFYYDLVRLRYPNVRPYCDLATQRMHELKEKVEKEKGAGSMPPIAPLGVERPMEQPSPAQPEMAPPPRRNESQPEPPPPPPPPQPLPPSLNR